MGLLFTDVAASDPAYYKKKAKIERERPFNDQSGI